MSGVVVPVHIVVEPFGALAAALPQTDPGGVTLPIPIPDQTGIVVGRASFDTGFGPANMVDVESAGGVQPFGQDVNGILYTMSAYCALLQAGQRVNWNAVASAAFVGYKIGASVASITTPGRVWTNYVDGNTNDPDVTPTGWAASDPLYSASAPAAGVYQDVVLPGASDYALDVDTTAGAIDYGGFVAQRNGQRITLSNTGANLLRALANSGGSAAGNQIRNATNLALVQNQSLTIQYFSGLNRWLLV